MTKKMELLNAALTVLSQGESLTLDAVAREAGLTKPGVMHHFPTKQILATAVVDRLVDVWEAQLTARIDDDATPRERLRAYVDFALTADMDPSDLALLADLRLRDQLKSQWMERLAPWLGENIPTDSEGRASLRAARLIADGAWFGRALGVLDLDQDRRTDILTVAQGLITQGLNTGEQNSA